MRYYDVIKSNKDSSWVYFIVAVFMCVDKAVLGNIEDFGSYETQLIGGDDIYAISFKATNVKEPHRVPEICKQNSTLAQVTLQAWGNYKVSLSLKS